MVGERWAQWSGPEQEQPVAMSSPAAPIIPIMMLRLATRMGRS
jgi:hypothetical protein